MNYSDEEQLAAIQELIAIASVSPYPARTIFNMADLGPRNVPDEWGVDLGLSEPLPIKAAFNVYLRILSGSKSVSNENFITTRARSFFRVKGFKDVSFPKNFWKELLFSSFPENILKSDILRKDLAIIENNIPFSAHEKFVWRIKRSSIVRKIAIDRSHGRCEYCRKDAPFFSAYNVPFLEVHHIDRLADNGLDAPQNVIAVCPNCHRNSHFGKDSKQINQEMKKYVAELEQQHE